MAAHDVEQRGENLCIKNLSWPGNLLCSFVYLDRSYALEMLLQAALTHIRGYSAFLRQCIIGRQIHADN